MNLPLPALVLAAAAGTGCATMAVSELGRNATYGAFEQPARVVVLHDRRVVVDYSRGDERPHDPERVPERIDWSYRRVYYVTDDFRATRAQPGVPSVPLDGRLDARIARRLATTHPDDEPGTWLPLPGDPARLPAIPEQDRASGCFHLRDEVSVQVAGRLVAICDEEVGTPMEQQTEQRIIKTRRWWYYPTRALYVPAVAFDVVTSPIQAVWFLWVMHDW